MNEFKVNDFLSLKLEGEKINIYVKERYFNLCKFLMLNAPVSETENFDDVESIDEVADTLGWTFKGQEGIKYEIDPEIEFWGHCSNLQVWYEHNYDTSLLHSNLSFPLLRKLVEVGDPLAKRVFKKEIEIRFESGYPSVIDYIFEEELLDYLNREEQKLLFEHSILRIFKARRKHSRTTRDIILDIIRYSASKEIELSINILPVLFKTIDNFEESDKINAFLDLLACAREKKWVEDYCLNFLETIEKLPHEDKYCAFNVLIDSINNLNVLNKYIDRIETQFLDIVDGFDKLPNIDKYPTFSLLLKVAEITGLIGKHFFAFLKTINKFYDEDKDKHLVFFNLLRVTEKIGWIEENFLASMEAIDKLPDIDKYHLFSVLIDSIKSTELLNKYHNRIETQFLTILDTIGNNYFAFSQLLITAEIMGLIKKHFFSFLAIIDKLPNVSYPGIKGVCTFEAFSELLKVSKETGLIEEHFSVFLETIDKLLVRDKYSAFKKLLKTTKMTKDIEKQVWAFLETRQEISQLFFIFEDYKIFKE